MTRAHCLAILLILASVCPFVAAQDAPVANPGFPQKFQVDSGLQWQELANPTRYIDAIGRKAAVFGKQDGKFEVWLWPIKVLHGFRLEFRLDNMPEPVRAENYLKSVTVRPESTTLLYVHPSFTVKQVIWAADDRSAVVQWFDVDADRALEITAKFVPDFKPMWPASMGGQHSSWSDEDKAFLLSDGTYKPTAIIGSPIISSKTEFMDHSLVGGEMLLRIPTEPSRARHFLYPLVMALSMNSGEEARATYRQVLANLRPIYEKKVDRWRAFLATTRKIVTPDADLNRAFVWAKVSIEQGWVCTAPPSAQLPGQSAPSVPKEGFAFPGSEECGIVAGYGPSFEGERPGFAWWFGGDGLMATWAMLDYGDSDGALRELRFLKSHQRADGKMMHEMVQSASLVDWWGKYHFAYMHADTTAMYLYSLGQYWQHTHDRRFLEEFWPSAKLAYQYCVSTLDPTDGLIDNTKSGLGAIEVGVLKGKVNKDIYVQGFWLGGARAMAVLAGSIGDKSMEVDANVKVEKAAASLRNNWWDPKNNSYAFGVTTDGQRAEILGNWSAALLSVGGGTGDARKDAEAARSYARPELATDWGNRWISNQSPLYDPLSYNNGTAWPFASGLVAWAQYANGQSLAGYQTIMSLVHLTGAQVPGGMPEHMVGNRNEPGARSIPRQIFSSWSLIRPVVQGIVTQKPTSVPIAVVPIKPTPELGARNTSMKILDVDSDEKGRTMSINLAGLPGRPYELELSTKMPKLQAEGVKKVRKIPTGYVLEIVFESGNDDDYVEKKITVKY